MRTDTAKSALWVRLVVLSHWPSWGSVGAVAVTERTAKGRSEVAVVTALAPICATQFQRS